MRQSRWPVRGVGHIRSAGHFAVRMCRLGIIVGVLLVANGLCAEAVVEDPDHALPPGQAQVLAERLEAMGAQDVVVVVRPRCEEGAVAAAENLFAERQLDDTALLLVLAMDDRHLGVATGASFGRAGITPAQVESVAAGSFAKARDGGDYATGIAEVVRKLKFARATGGTDNSMTRLLTVPLGLALLLSGIVLGGTAWYKKRRDDDEALRRRLAPLRATYKRLLERQAAYEALGVDMAGILNAVHQSLSRALTEFQARQHERAHRRLAELEPQVFWVEAGVVALQAWQAGGPSREADWRRFHELALQWQNTTVTVAFLAEAPGRRGVMLEVLRRRLSEARHILLQPIPGLDEAEVLLRAIQGQVSTLAMERRFTLKRDPEASLNPGLWDFQLPRYVLSEANAIVGFWDN